METDEKLSSVAVVLGASTGVGAAIALRLAENLYPVIGFHRGRHQAEALSQAMLLKCRAKQSQLIERDVGRNEIAVDVGVADVAKFASKQSVRVLVHSLSGASVNSVMKSVPYQVESTFNLLAHSFLWWVQGLQQCDLLAPNAKIIALSNPLPDFYLRNSGVIGAAKAALETYVKMLAVELGPMGMRINAIRFSTVLTSALRKVLSAEAVAALEKVHQHIVPAGTMQDADSVAQFVVKLVNDNWINGAVIDLTGGSTRTLLDYAFYNINQTATLVNPGS